PLVTPRALKSRGHQNPPPDCYWMLTNALLDTHHGVTRYDRATDDASQQAATAQAAYQQANGAADRADEYAREARQYVNLSD
ncbi:hypothetical protein, partial [Corynebacterium ureicelerivorans]|uniref:hypothetical protein n=1 Tax=Corynebacterium ureicelerivorans TaxID=401472 RepID=UPI0026519B16